MGVLTLMMHLDTCGKDYQNCSFPSLDDLAQMPEMRSRLQNVGCHKTKEMLSGQPS